MTNKVKREAAIKALSDKYIDRDNGQLIVDLYTYPILRFAQVEQEIRELRKLGKTARWGHAIDQWLSLFEDHVKPFIGDDVVDRLNYDNNAFTEFKSAFKWALLQGSIYALYATQ